MQPSLRNLLPMAAFGIFSTFLGGYFLLDSPFQSLRPSAAEHRTFEDSSLENIDARLWQDPLALVYDSIKRGDTAQLDDMEGLARRIHAHLAQDTHQLTILFGSVPGAPYAEDGETRRRTRHAILAGIAESGYIPNESEHIGALSVALPEQWRADVTSRAVMPFEWFRNPNQQGDELLLMWLNEDVFSGSFASRLSWITRRLFGFRFQRDREQALDLARIQLALIGPSGSDTLIAMINDTTDLAQESPSIVPDEPAKVFAESLNQAIGFPDTTENELSSRLEQWFAEQQHPVFPNLVQLKKDLQTILGGRYDPEAFETWWTTHHPTLDGWVEPRRDIPLIDIYSPRASASSFVLLGDQVQEDPFQNDLVIQAKIARSGVFGAFSTTIARDDDLTAQLVAEIKRRRNLDEMIRDDFDGAVVLISEWDTLYGRALPWAFQLAWEANPPANLDNPGEAIHRYGYFRGLDGVIPGAKQSPPRNAPKSNEQVLLSGDLPDASQLEQPFGRSQMDYVRRLSYELDQLNSTQNIRAIGVLGSDLYDKQLILQALRPRYPNAIFFTTDLDARMLHPSQFRWARNIVVASSYGLRLRNDLQTYTPPFRDTYQTAIFLASRMALRPVKFSPPSNGRLFEVGRRQAFALNIPDEAYPVLDPHPSRQAPLEKITNHRNGPRLLIFTLVLVFIIWRVSPLHRLMRESIDRGNAFNQMMGELSDIWRNLLWGGLWWISVAVIFILLILIAWHDHLQNGEPLMLTMGVSMWPTVMIVAFAGALGVDFIRKDRKANYRNRQTIENQYFDTLDINQEYSAVTLWRRYMCRRYDHHTAAWTLILWLSTFFVLLYDTPRPGRGLTILLTSEIIMFTTGLIVTFLVINAIEQTLHCGRFIANLACQRAVIWPDSARNAYDPGFKNRNALSMVDELLDIRLIINRSRIIANYIIHPFIVMLVLLLAHNSVFDHWRPTPYVVLFFGSLSMCLLYCGYVLRRKAEDARAAALAQLTEKWQNVQDKNEEDEALYEKLRTEISETDEGILAPWSRHPVLHAVLYPLGGLSTLALLDVISLLQ